MDNLKDIKLQFRHHKGFGVYQLIISCQIAVIVRDNDHRKARKKLSEFAIKNLSKKIKAELLK